MEFLLQKAYPNEDSRLSDNYEPSFKGGYLHFVNNQVYMHYQGTTYPMSEVVIPELLFTPQFEEEWGFQGISLKYYIPALNQYVGWVEVITDVNKIEPVIDTRVADEGYSWRLNIHCTKSRYYILVSPDEVEVPEMLHGTFLENISVLTNSQYKTKTMDEFIADRDHQRPYVSHMVECSDGYVYCLKDRDDYFRFPLTPKNEHPHYNNLDNPCTIHAAASGLVLASYNPYQVQEETLFPATRIYFLANPILLLGTKLPF